METGRPTQERGQEYNAPLMLGQAMAVCDTYQARPREASQGCLASHYSITPQQAFCKIKTLEPFRSGFLSVGATLMLGYKGRGRGPLQNFQENQPLSLWKVREGNRHLGESHKGKTTGGPN